MLDPHGRGSSGAPSTGAAPSRPTAAIVLAAGEGTRMRSAVPKVLHPIAGRSLLGHAVHAVAALEPEHLVVVVGAGGDQVREAVSGMVTELARPVLTAEQPERKGTGHAVRCALDALPAGLTGPIVVTYGDVPLLEPVTLAALLTDHAASGAPLTLLTSDAHDPTGYGRVVRESDGTVTRIVEEVDATPEQRALREVNSGVYAFDAAFLLAAIDRLRGHNRKGELYLTDLVKIAHDDGSDVRGVRCADDWQVRGVNDRVQLAATRAELNRRLLEHWMLAGVTVIDPATTWVDVQVRLEPDVVLHPGTQLHGTTWVAGGAEIGAGTKVPHLTYVGDATIGENSNIGASSVFVNYDGVRKQRTVVGSHVKTGSDNTFVAPVHIGDGAYTGAGTVVRDDVPPGALAVSAGSQRTIEGWVARKRPGTPAAEAAARAADPAIDVHGGTAR